MLALLLAFGIFVIYRYVFRIWITLGHYKAQGVLIVDGAYTPVLGDMTRMLPLIEKAMAGTGDKSSPQLHLVRDAVAKNGGYDSNKTKAVMLVHGTTPSLAILDPEMTKQIYLNSKVDKTGKFQEIFKDFLGKGMLFSKGDQHWYNLRKACAHAFYKERL